MTDAVTDAAPSSPDAPFAGRRVVVINDAPAPFRFPLFAELERRFADLGVTSSILFWTTRPPTRPHFHGLVERETFRWHDAGCRSLLLGEYKLMSPVGIRARLDELRPDAIVSTGCAGPSLAALRWARRRHVPFLLWWGGRARDCTRWYHPWLHARVVRRCDGFVAYGSEARDYLVARGAPPDRVHIGLNTRDTTAFAAQVEGLRATPPRLFDGADAALRERVRDAAAGRTNLLVVSRLQPYKNVAMILRLLRAAIDARHAPPALRLHVVGDGPERPALEALARDLDLGDAVAWWGMQPSNQMPLFYAIGDVALAPSLHETWGFAQVEAMASGLPVLSSTWAACTADIIHDGADGFALHPHDEAAWGRALARLLDDPDARRRIGDAARRTAREDLSVARSAEGFVAAVEAAWRRAAR